MADENNTGIPAATEQVPSNTQGSNNPIDRMIDISIEAMDGKAPSTDTNTEASSGNTTPTNTEGNASTDNKDSNSGGSNNQQQSGAAKEGTQESKQAHSPRDLTLQDGTVVKGGAERRFYEQREVAREQAQAAQQRERQAVDRAERAETELRTLRETTQQLHGVDPDQLRIGARIVSDLQRDPVGTMKKLLAETIAQGYTIEGIGAGVDALAMQRIIDARLPEQNSEPTEQDIMREAKEVVNTFYASHPDAKPHDALLGRMLRDNPGLDLETAYYELRNGFIEKGLDFSRPLHEQVQQASSQSNTQQSQSNPNNTQQQQPMPNGRMPEGAVKPAGEVKIAHEDTDMGDIVRAAMRESGMKV